MIKIILDILVDANNMLLWQLLRLTQSIEQIVISAASVVNDSYMQASQHPIEECQWQGKLIGRIAY